VPVGTEKQQQKSKQARKKERELERKKQSLLTRCFISRWNQIFIIHSTDRQSTSQQQRKIAAKYPISLM